MISFCHLSNGNEGKHTRDQTSCTIQAKLHWKILQIPNIHRKSDKPIQIILIPEKDFVLNIPFSHSIDKPS